MSTDFDNKTAPDVLKQKPFFGKSDSTDDFALFIRSCQQPPMLELFVVEPSLVQTINQLNEELRTFEWKFEEFDRLVSNLHYLQENHKLYLFCNFYNYFRIICWFCFVFLYSEIAEKDNFQCE